MLCKRFDQLPVQNYCFYLFRLFKNQNLKLRRITLGEYLVYLAGNYERVRVKNESNFKIQLLVMRSRYTILSQKHRRSYRIWTSENAKRTSTAKRLRNVKKVLCFIFYIWGQILK